MNSVREEEGLSLRVLSGKGGKKSWPQFVGEEGKRSLFYHGSRNMRKRPLVGLLTGRNKREGLVRLSPKNCEKGGKKRFSYFRGDKEREGATLTTAVPKLGGEGKRRAGRLSYHRRRAITEPYEKERSREQRKDNKNIYILLILEGEEGEARARLL